MEELRKKDGLSDSGRGVKSERPQKPNEQGGDGVST
jgi:hypothetical protein